MAKQLKKSDVDIFGEKIEDLKVDMLRQVTEFEDNIQLKTQKFNENDTHNCEKFIKQFWSENLTHLNHYFEKIYSSKSGTFDKQINSSQSQYQLIMELINSNYADLHRSFDKLKEQDWYKGILMEHMIDQFIYQQRRHLAFKIWKDYWKKKQLLYKNLKFCRNFYIRNLKNKCLFSWRNISYKTAFEAKIQKKYENDVKNVNTEYQCIIRNLQKKIQETEELIRIKKLAKSEFAFSLSRSFLKTISNLSMEVMSLNQVTIKDQNVEQENNHKFLKDVSEAVSKKFQEIDQQKESLKREVYVNCDFGPTAIAQSRKPSVQFKEI